LSAERMKDLRDESSRNCTATLLDAVWTTIDIDGLRTVLAIGTHASLTASMHGPSLPLTEHGR